MAAKIEGTRVRVVQRHKTIRALPRMDGMVAK